jgi:hypothetical protein
MMKRASRNIGPLASGSRKRTAAQAIEAPPITSAQLANEVAFDSDEVSKYYLEIISCLTSDVGWQTTIAVR